jgi:hypothetical protein
MADLQNDTASYDTPADAGKPPRGTVTRWLKEIDLQGRVEADWRKQGEAVLKRFRDEAQLEKGSQKARKLGAKFNILRPNTRVMKAAVYQDPPKPDVRQRFKDRDPLAKAVSEVTERSLSFCMDKYDFDGAMQLAVNDMLLPGRAVTRVRYEPQTAPQVDQAGKPRMDAKGQPMEQVAWEKVCWRHVQWDDYRRGPGKTWDQVTWQAFRHRLTRDEAEKEIPEAKALLKDIEFDCQSEMTEEDQKAVTEDPSLADVFKRLTVWEVWDKTKREVLFIAPSYKDKPLVTRKDPLGLEEFFDTPRPLYAVEESDTLIPLEDFRAYADQAKELDNVTARIDGIVAQLKVRGLYDATLKQLADLMSSDDGTLIPSEETAALYNQGGIEKGIWLMPIDKIASVLKYLYEHREQVKQLVYEITGLSDIMRGSSKASETATAQSIKAQNGAISIQDRRKSVKRYARDLVRIGSEIICEHFQPATLKAMTGSDYPTEQEKQQLGMQLQQIQQQMAMQQQMAASSAPQQPPAGAGGSSPVAPPAGAPQPLAPPPELEQIQKRLEMPTWEQIIQVMKSDALRSYRIDVETDETAFGDQQAEQQAVVELLGAATTFMTSMIPLMQGGVVKPEVAKSLLLLATRRFKAGREVEDALEDLGDGPMPPPADPNAGKVEVEKERMEMERGEAEQTRAFEREKFEEEKRAKQIEETRAGDEFEFTKKQHQDGIDERTGAEAMKAFGAEFPTQLQTVMQGLEQALAMMVQSNQQTQQVVAQSAQREAAMMQAMTQSIVGALKAPKKTRVTKRGKDGKIAEVESTVGGNGVEARM